MELKEMEMEQLIERRSAIATEVDAPEADLDALESEARAINEEIEARKQAEAQKAEIRAAVADGAGEVTETIVEEKREKKMSDIEIRNSAEYIDAYAEYIKTGDDTECRALLTENVSGTVAVPELVYDIVKTAWQREGIMSRVRKSYLKGNLKVQFEISATDAHKHTEGSGEVSEETLVLGIVNLVPVSIKKWISISDEALDLRGEAFLNYIYDELAYKIAKKAADELVAAIKACGTVSTTTCPSVQVLAGETLGVGTIAKALGKLSDEANDPVIIINKATWSAFKAAQYAGSFSVDPFEGLPVVFNNTITAYSAASTGDTYAIVGDLGHGALANFPAGEGISFKFDDISLATSDLVKIIGRQYIAEGVVAADAFVKINK